MYKKTAFFAAVGFLFAFAASAQEADPYRLSTHILDISKGMPAANVQVDLEKYNSETDLGFSGDGTDGTKRPYREFCTVG